MLIVNDKAAIADDSKFWPFITQLIANGTYTYNQDILKHSYRHLPLHMRDADLTMVAGAYKSGSIACYDNNGNIVDLGFSRTGSAYGIVQDFVLYQNNTPVLDGVFYKENVVGYLIEGSIQNVVTSFDALTLSQSGDFYSLSNPRIMTIYNNTIQSRSRFNYIRNSASAYKWFFRSMLLPNKDNIGTKTTTLGTNTNGPVVIHDIKDEPPKLKGYKLIESALTSSTAGNVSGGVFVFIASVWSSSIGMVVGDNGKVLFLNMIMVDNSVTSIDQVPKKILPNNTICEADTIAPITLTNNALIHIKTAKGIQEFTLSAGSFNINDYVVNDKLICFAVKYL